MFGNVLRQYREKAGMDTFEIAKHLGLKKNSCGNLYRWEKETLIAPLPRTIREIAKKLKAPVEILLLAAYADRAPEEIKAKVLKALDPLLPEEKEFEDKKRGRKAEKNEKVEKKAKPVKEEKKEAKPEKKVKKFKKVDIEETVKADAKPVEPEKAEEKSEEDDL